MSSIHQLGNVVKDEVTEMRKSLWIVHVDSIHKEMKCGQFFVQYRPPETRLNGIKDSLCGRCVFCVLLLLSNQLEFVRVRGCSDKERLPGFGVGAARER